MIEHKLKYVDNSYARSGTLLKDITLESMLNHCLMLPKTGKKGNFGSIFIYDSIELGLHEEDELSTGLILVDIDNISKEVANKIYDYFDLLASYWHCLLAIQYSSSHYIDKNKSGLHIFIQSNKLDKNEYNKQSQICLAIFSQLIYTYLHIDLLDIKEQVIKNKPILDFHNTNLYQRFNLFYSEFKYNDETSNFSLDNISFSELEQLVKKYNLVLDKEIRKTISPVLNNIMIGTGKRIKVDRNLKIGRYSGNDIRFRISIIADKLFNDNAKDFCDRFFYYNNNKSIYTHYPHGNTINPLIYKWLVENKYVIESSRNIINNWIDEKRDEIEKNIDEFKHIQIIAPTGSGKTTFINNYLAKKYNAIVIVPFNVTNKLYDNLFEINSTYHGKVPKNKSCVMIWDQAIKYWTEIKDRHIIIDESHTLFLDRTYRDSAVKLIMKLRDNNSKIIFISATPAGEKEMFDDTKVLEYYKERDIISLNINATNNIEWAQYNYIKKCLDNNWYDKIVLLDDRTVKKIYERFIIEGYGQDICYIRSSTKDSADFIDLRENELLRKKITLCTCIAFNGLNFKNYNENILVIGSIKQGETTSNEIIQQIGRIRNSKVSAIYFYDDKIYTQDIEEKEHRTKEKYSLHIPDFIGIDYRYLDNDYIMALKEIEQYLDKHAYLNRIIEELGYTGYISGYINDKIKNDKIVKMSLALKRKESNEMKEDIINGRYFEKEYDEEYKSKWMKEINRLISNESYEGINIDMFIELLNKSPKNKLIETSINIIKEAIRVLTIDDKLFEKVIKEKEQYKNKLSNEIDRRDFIKNLNHMIKIKNQYKDRIKIKEDKIYFFEVVRDIIAMEEERQKNLSKNYLQSKKVKDLLTNKEYDSITECANDVKLSKSYICRLNNRFIIS